MPTRNQIITEARTWIGTKFHHQGRLKKSAANRGGCDCLGLLVGVARDLRMRSALDKSRAFLSQFDDTAYARIPNGKKLREKLDNLLHPVDAENMDVGDVLLLKFGKNPQHLGIVSDYPVTSAVIPGLTGDRLSDPRSRSKLLGGDDKSLNHFGLIHCFRQVGQVVEHRLDEYWREKIVGVYSFFAVIPPQGGIHANNQA